MHRGLRPTQSRKPAGMGVEGKAKKAQGSQEGLQEVPQSRKRRR